MELTSSDVYWVMQADTIVFFISLSAAVLTFCCLTACTTLYLAAALDNSLDEDDVKNAVKWANRCACVFVFVAFPLAVTATLFPKTKTQAAMIVLPAVVNNEEIYEETTELYELTKEALQQMVEDK